MISLLAVIKLKMFCQSLGAVYGRVRCIVGVLCCQTIDGLVCLPNIISNNR